MSTSSNSPTVKRYKGSRFIIAFLIGMALFGAIGFGLTYIAANAMAPALKKKQDEARKRDAAIREKARAAEAAGRQRQKLLPDATK
jgi:hypothetical protein